MVAVAKRERDTVPTWTADQFRAFREARGLTHEQAGALIGVSARAWYYYEQGQRTPSAAARLILSSLSKKKK